MNNNNRTQPSRHSELVLNALKQAATKEIEKKRRLGQYVVLWGNDAIIYEGEDAPKQEKSQPNQPSHIINNTFT